MALQKALPRSLFAFIEKYVLTSGYFLPIFTSVLSVILEVPWHVSSLRGRLVSARQFLVVSIQNIKWHPHLRRYTSPHSKIVFWSNAWVRPRLNILTFLPILGWNILENILRLIMNEAMILFTLKWPQDWDQRFLLLPILGCPLLVFLYLSQALGVETWQSLAVPLGPLTFCTIQ